jgi:23S rRNA pseudouridine1911/1915/1917 synthase
MHITVSAEDSGTRLDVFLTQQIDSFSRSSVEKLIKQEDVSVNGASVPSKYKVKEHDSIDISFDFDAKDSVPDITLPILYEDDDCLVIEKPAGILTHSKGAFNPEATVATFIHSRISGMDGDRAGIVHRLDRATSGVIICAKHPRALSDLQAEFSKRNVKKTYYAVVKGIPEPAEAIIEVPIGRNPKDPKTFYPTVHGKVATTSYKLLDHNAERSFLELSPTTGRTHQLRVHMKYIKHPIVGDEVYDGKPADRMYLHAGRLEITLPSRERKVFESATPKSFRELVD